METNVNGRKFELWVVDKPALEKILKNIYEPDFGNHLKDKIIVVPMSVYNEVLMGPTARTGTITFGSSAYELDNKSRTRIKFMFVPSGTSLHETVEYCIKNLEELTRQICWEEEIGLTELAKWPAVKIAYDMTSKPGRPYLWDLGESSNPLS